MATRVILADDHTVMRQGLRSLLSAQPGMEVVAEAGDGRSAVALARKLAPDAVIMDISMPGLNGIEATRQIVADLPRVKVIALSMHSDRRFVAQVLKAGAVGYLLKDCAFDELARAIRTCIAGQVYLSPGIAGAVVEDYLRKISGGEAAPGGADGSPGGGEASPLTDREREVLQLLAEGNSTKDIAAALSVSGKTVETHRRRLMLKLNMFTVAELTKYAIREGMTTAEK